MFYRISLLLSVLALQSGCTLVSAVDAVASTAIDVTAGTVKLTGKAIGAALPDSDNEEDDENDS